MFRLFNFNAKRQFNFNLEREDVVQCLTEILFCDGSENVNEFGDEGTECEDKMDDRVENSENEHSDEEDIIRDAMLTDI